MANGIVLVQGTLELHKVAIRSMTMAIYNVLDCTDFRCLVVNTEMLSFVKAAHVVPQYFRFEATFSQ